MLTRIRVSDGVELQVEDCGTGQPILFIHEFAGDMRQWGYQVRRLSRTHRCISYNARGYPPSDVPEGAEAYSQDIVIADALAILDALGIASAHIVGHSMGAYTALHLGIRHSDRCRSVVAAGVGYGSDPAARKAAEAEMKTAAEMFRTLPMADSAALYGAADMRKTFARKDPVGFQAFVDRMSEHSGLGHALTMENLQMKRPTLQDMRDGLTSFRPPLFVIAGDDDDGCLEGSLMIKRTAPNAGLLVLPHCSHMMPTEEPALFTEVITEFIRNVESRS